MTIFFNVRLNNISLAGLWSYPPISFEAIPGHPLSNSCHESVLNKSVNSLNIRIPR